MPNIQDVARRAKVSSATVSRVLSNPDVVLPETRERVQEAIDALNYVPNSAAKSLRTLRTAKILVTVPDISNAFFSAVIRGVEEAASEAGYTVLLGDTRHDPAREEQYAVMLHRKEADGLIFLGHRMPPTLQRQVAQRAGRAPIVNGCEFSPDLGVSSAHIDNAAAAAKAMRHLFDLGHRRVGVITGPLASPLSRDRLDGARMAAAERGLLGGLVVRTGDFSVQSGARETGQLLKSTDAPTALFCFSDEMALGALHAIRACGLRCPEDVSVVGFDDIRYAAYSEPPLTTISQPSADIGREAVRLLLDILNGSASAPVAVTLPYALVLRDSTAPPQRAQKRT
jgi:LacI family repressor for deo operon, udp, cdd, tsx, nupC, and nupG